MRAFLFLAAFLACAPASAILIRADRDDAEYVELATRYPSAVQIAPGLEGVLISPRWILTSAQVATRLEAMKPRPALAIGGSPNAVKATFVHPEWRQGSDADIALVFLRDPVPSITPTPVQPDHDELEEVVFVVGHGETGKIGDRVRSNDGKKRAAINTVDVVTATTLRLRTKPPDDASDLQGAPSDSERGAPAFLERSGRTSVVGVFSAGEREWQIFTRVSTYTKWIDDTMFRTATEDATKAR